jgi:nicotinamidase-related amidase
MSFSGEDTKIELYKTNVLLNDYINSKDYKPFNGNFPAHCIQCHSGSSFIPDLITRFFKTNAVKENYQKIKIVFKGIHPDIDSFTAVAKTDIDMYASNVNYSDSNTICQNSSCSTITGGFMRKDSYNSYDELMEDVNYHNVIDQNDIEIKQADYKKILQNVEQIQVCGLAGDYCVRDTIVALSEMFNKKEIVLINDLTRYATLPLSFMKKLPKHISKFSMEIQNNNNDELMNTQNKLSKIPLFTENELNDIATLIKSTKLENKDINYYLMKDGPVNTKLASVDDLEKITTDELIKAINDPESATYFHFITSGFDILDDYSNFDNIKIKLNMKNVQI